jgi:hypothetical protein
VPQLAQLRASEDRFIEEASLREKVAALRQHAASLEAAVQDKEAVAVDLRFELETEREAHARCKRRWRGVVCVSALCCVVWCGVVWCGVVWCGVVWCGVVWCGVWAVLG